MVLHVASDVGQIVRRLDATGAQLVRQADAGLQQDVRGIVGAQRENHFPLHANGSDVAEVVDLDTGGAAAGEPDPQRQRVRSTVSSAELVPRPQYGII